MSEAAAEVHKSEGQIEQEKRNKASAKLRGTTKRAYEAFQKLKTDANENVSLPSFGAAIFVVHLFEVREDAEVMNGSELRAFALGFRHQNPVVWATLVRGHSGQFVKAMQRSGLKTAKESEFGPQTTIIRSAS